MNKQEQGQMQIDVSVFLEAMQDVIPLQPRNTVISNHSRVDEQTLAYRRDKAECLEGEAAHHLSMTLKKTLTTDDWLNFKREGIQSAVFRNLRLGKYRPEVTANFNKMSISQLQSELIKLMQDCEASNVRSVLIHFGQGKHAILIKSYLAQWMVHLKKVQAFHSAQKFDGGLASVYVLLQKSQQQRLENKERHAARLKEIL